VNKNPTDATVCRYLFTAKLLYMFRVSQHPSPGKTFFVSFMKKSYKFTHNNCHISVFASIISQGPLNEV